MKSWETTDFVSGVKFKVYCDPLPWARARRRGQRCYIPVTQRRMRDAIAGAFRTTGHEGFGPGYCRLFVEAIFRKPKRTKKPYPTKSDMDNHVKQIQDSLNGIAWTDDRQIVQIIGSKRWAVDGENAGYVVEIDEILSF